MSTSATPPRATLLERLLGSPRIEEALAEAAALDRADVAAKRRGIMAEVAELRAGLEAEAAKGGARIAKAEDEARRVAELHESAQQSLRRTLAEAAGARLALEGRISRLEGELAATAPGALEDFRLELVEQADRLRKVRPETRVALLGFHHGDRESRAVYDRATNADQIAAALRATVEAGREVERARLTCAGDEEAAELVARLREGIPEILPPDLPGEVN